MDLPQEILGMIFSHYVDHFGQRSDAVEETIEEHCLNRKTLASLCRVCKSFNAVATSLLYKEVRMFDGDTRFFTRTILQDHLKSKISLVKRLSLEFEMPGRWDPETLDVARRERVPTVRQEQWDYNRCLEEAFSVVGADDVAISATGGWAADAFVSMKLDLEDKFEEDLAAVLLFFLPELRTLRVKCDPMTAHYDDDMETAGYWRCDMLLQTLRLPYYNSYMVAGQESSNHDSRENIHKLVPASLLKLEELIMCNPFEEPGTIKTAYPPRVWCHLDELQPLWALPNLKSLTLERVAWDHVDVEFDLSGQCPKDFAKSTSVEHLELLDTAIVPSALPLLLHCFPSLRSVTYELADSFSLIHEDRVMTLDMLDSRRIQAIIRNCKPGLEKICVKAVDRDELDEEQLAELEGTGQDEDEDE